MQWRECKKQQIFDTTRSYTLSIDNYTIKILSILQSVFLNVSYNSALIKAFIRTMLVNGVETCLIISFFDWKSILSIDFHLNVGYSVSGHLSVSRHYNETLYLIDLP